MKRRSEPHTFDENLSAEKARLEVAFANIKPGPQRELLERKLRQIETASHINEWLTSPGLQPPK
ncbi:hypothetical protein [Bradyrhizobium arachidis]|uniref:hypothetical protein n=1 Tax=Bradyrhizobium arachidis TaxID=858423 RepID=UPI00216383A2|nr:hypothetical protein [Bradyrhizobium arachidis]UVO33590.1 hypothetical protein KUF59_31225 [Bradyrhizobium arachidis]